MSNPLAFASFEARQREIANVWMGGIMNCCKMPASKGAPTYENTAIHFNTPASVWKDGIITECRIAPAS